MTKVYNDLLASLSEVRGVVLGEAEPARIVIPPEIDTRRIRRELGLTQEAFAGRYGFSVDQIRAWERGRSCPAGGVRAYLLLIDRKPAEVAAMLGEAASAAAASPRPSARRPARRGRPGNAGA